MRQRPPLEYETRRPPEEAGFLAKCNPQATRRSVLRRAASQFLLGASLYVLFSVWNERLRAVWPVALPLWSLVCACMGALVEWQVADENDDGDTPAA